MDDFALLAAYNISPHATTQNGNLMAETAQKLNKAQSDVWHLQRHLEESRAETAHARADVARLERLLGASRALLREDIAASRALTLWGHIKMWWENRA